ncbi:MAG: hypothetical protein IJL32_14990 [Oscillospiraceae bacterium]|nr:hypothetical protein [Oscillospiraceae bacterium]
MKKLIVPVSVLVPAGLVALLTKSEAAALTVLAVSVVIWAIRLIRSALGKTRAIEDVIRHKDD